jgi:hypothetical protein
MAKKKDKTMAYVVVGAIALIVIYGISKNGITLNVTGAGTAQVPLNPQVQYYQYNVRLSVTPQTICVGQTTTGSIASNIPNGICTIFANANNAGFQFFANVNLDASGKFSSTQQVNSVGTVMFRAICCDNSGNCRVGNDVLLTVNQCNQPPAQTKYYCCLAMGLKSCYENGCPPAGQQLGIYNSLPECQLNCQNPQQEPEGYYNSGECQNVTQAMFSQTQETDYDPTSCKDTAWSTCNAYGEYFPTNIDFARNCCWWDCKYKVAKSGDECQATASALGRLKWIYWMFSIR